MLLRLLMVAQAALALMVLASPLAWGASAWLSPRGVVLVWGVSRALWLWRRVDALPLHAMLAGRACWDCWWRRRCCSAWRLGALARCWGCLPCGCKRRQCCQCWRSQGRAAELPCAGVWHALRRPIATGASVCHACGVHVGGGARVWGWRGLVPLRGICVCVCVSRWVRQVGGTQYPRDLPSRLRCAGRLRCMWICSRAHRRAWTRL